MLDENVEGPEIQGVFEIEEVEEGAIEEVQPGMDVCVYTAAKRSRPWVGRVSTIDERNNFFILHWFERVEKSNTFKAMYVDGKPFEAQLSLESIMMWAFSEDREVDSFKISNFWLTGMKAEYTKLDG